MTFCQPVPMPERRQPRSTWSKKKYPKTAEEKQRWKDSVYLRRPILSFDGEGWDVNGTHRYCLLAAQCDTDNQLHSIYEEYGLTLQQIVNFLFDMKRRYPKALMVMFGFSYDVNMWLKQSPVKVDELTKLHKEGGAKIGDYFIKFMDKKKVQITRYDPKETITIYDTMTFYGGSFESALESYLGEDYPHRELIAENKALRGSFENVPRSTIEKYNQAELELMNTLTSELRARLYKIGLKPSTWHGPGAVAGVLLRRHHIVRDIVPTPKKLHMPVQGAYAGGRFEVIRHGLHLGPCYQYDINSAYPYAATQLPSLAHGRWVHEMADTPLSLYLIEIVGKNEHHAQPLFHRLSQGNITYPRHTLTWVWSPEYHAIKEWAALGHGSYLVHDAWSFHDNGHRPFAFIHDLYQLRLELKSQGDGAQLAAKLALNSIYGKLAQQVGWKGTIDNPKPPPFHQLEYAGFITSFTRAQLLRAALQQPDDVIAFETDAIFTTAPLNLPVSTALGDWGMDTYDGILYGQSGIRCARQNGQWLKPKARGIPDRAITAQNMLDSVLAFDPEKATGDAPGPVIHLSASQFTKLGLGLQVGLDQWAQWHTHPRTVKLFPDGKRMFLSMQYEDGLNTTCILQPPHPQSHPHPIEWRPSPRDPSTNFASLRREPELADLIGDYWQGT